MGLFLTFELFYKIFEIIFVIFHLCDFRIFDFIYVNFIALPRCHAFFYVFYGLIFLYLFYILWSCLDLIYIIIEIKKIYYSSWQRGNGGNVFLESFII